MTPPVGPEDAGIGIASCGVNHSDVHQARDEFDCALATLWPCLPRHEIAGTVAVAGPGGLGHPGLQLAKARGADRVIALTTTPTRPTTCASSEPTRSST